MRLHVSLGLALGLFVAPAFAAGNLDPTPEKIAAFILLGADYRSDGKDTHYTAIRQQPLTFRKYSGEIVTVIAEDNCHYKVQSYNKKEESLYEQTFDFTKLRRIALKDTMLGVWALNGKSAPKFNCWSAKPKNGTIKTGCFESLTDDPEDIYVEADGGADPKDISRAYRIFVQNICRIPE
jgi:hypothetical protein